MKEPQIDITTLRREYTRNGLRRIDLTTEPMELFALWLNQACKALLPDATAMCAATVDNIGQPYQRLVLLKHFDENSMIFYTNICSRKAKHLTQNPRISLHFPWHILERQVMVLGKVQRLSIAEVIKYFHSRPRDSQISAWVSHQSNPISTRSLLENKFIELKQKFLHNEVPLPNFWGGYKVIINTVEFWQGGRNRLHDRFIYQRNKNSWHIDRLAP